MPNIKCFLSFASLFIISLNKNNIFSESEVDTAIKNVMELIDAATSSDELFEEIVAVTPPRSLNNLK